MAATRYFIEKGIQYVEIDEYFKRELDRAGYGYINISKTPMGHRIVIYAVRLGMVIGKRGRNIRRLTQELEGRYGLESPQLEIKELTEAELHPEVAASRLVSQIQRGFHFRRAGYSLLRRISASGAPGVEISVSGKLTSQRSRRETFRVGFVAKSGEPARIHVKAAVVRCLMKQGVIGVRVRIMMPGVRLPDQPELLPNPFPEEEEKEEFEEIEDEEELVEEIEDEEELVEEIKDEEELVEEIEDEEELVEEIEDEEELVEEIKDEEPVEAESQEDAAAEPAEEKEPEAAEFLTEEELEETEPEEE
ncbi:MAG: 30S ribosomal protein S3 [Candidatus Hodarchaeales archaeon]